MLRGELNCRVDDPAWRSRGEEPVSESCLSRGYAVDGRRPLRPLLNGARPSEERLLVRGVLLVE